MDGHRRRRRARRSDVAELAPGNRLLATALAAHRERAAVFRRAIVRVELARGRVTVHGISSAEQRNIARSREVDDAVFDASDAQRHSVSKWNHLEERAGKRAFVMRAVAARDRRAKFALVSRAMTRP